MAACSPSSNELPRPAGPRWRKTRSQAPAAMAAPAAVVGTAARLEWRQGRHRQRRWRRRPPAPPAARVAPAATAVAPARAAPAAMAAPAAVVGTAARLEWRQGRHRQRRWRRRPITRPNSPVRLVLWVVSPGQIAPQPPADETWGDRLVCETKWIGIQCGNKLLNHHKAKLTCEACSLGGISRPNCPAAARGRNLGRSRGAIGPIPARPRVSPPGVRPPSCSVRPAASLIRA